VIPAGENLLFVINRIIVVSCLLIYNFRTTTRRRHQSGYSALSHCIKYANRATEYALSLSYHHSVLVLAKTDSFIILINLNVYFGSAQSVSLVISPPVAPDFVFLNETNLEPGTLPLRFGIVPS
jgi:hypothetical protein